MKNGRITQPGTATSVDVRYRLSVNGRDDAGGYIEIQGDPTPGYRFMGNPSSAFPGNLNYTLHTEGGVTVEIFFNSSNGTFVCVLADEARSAIKAGG